MQELRALCSRRGLQLIEDAAQAFGARLQPGGAYAGTVGEAGCLSFFSKSQLSMGEGGMVLSADPAIAARVRQLRSHAMTSGTWDRHQGHEDSYDILDVGFNFRLDEPRASLGLSRAARVTEEIAHRRAIVRSYRDQLSDVPGVTLMWDDAAVEAGSHFAFSILYASVIERNEARRRIGARGIETTHYPALHTLSTFASLAAPGSLPNSEAVADRHLALPLSAHLGDAQVAEVVAAVRQSL